MLLVLFGFFGCTFGLTISHYQQPHQHEIIQHKQPHIPIVKQDFQQGKEGYQFSYETGNGIHVQESGQVKNLGDKKHETIVKHGSVTYHDEHGHPITLTYVADEHGFQAQGAHLPTPPPVPYEIQKALQQHQQQQQHSNLVIPQSQEEYGQQFDYA